MRLTNLYRALVLALAFVVPLLSAVDARASASPLVFPDDVRELTNDEALTLAYLWDNGCRVFSPSPVERAALRAAADRIRAALDDPRIAALLLAKKDLIVEGADGAFVSSDGAGAAVLGAFQALAAGDRPVRIFSYDGARGQPCHLPLSNGANINAYTQIGVPVIVFHRAYLESLANAADREAGEHALARTLAHELTHVLGYTHHDRPSTTGIAYDNTVPVYVGCLTSSWPDTSYAEQHCHRVQWARPATSWAWSCDRRASLGARAVDQAIELRIGDEWVPGRVVEIDAALGRVRVDLGLSSAEKTWVDACRLR